MKRVYIITGVGGHLGNTVARELLAAGETVRGFALPSEDITMLYGDAVSIVRGDVRDKSSLEPLFFGLTPEDEIFVIHCAGIVSVASKFDQRVVDVMFAARKMSLTFARSTGSRSWSISAPSMRCRNCRMAT